MHYQKPATTIPDQIDLLRSRGLVIDSEDIVKNWLHSVGYYRLSAYWLFFETNAPATQTRSKRFKAGTRFEDIIDLYVFDRKLRLLVMEAIERLEIAVRSRWTNRLSLAHGAHAHLQSEHFQSGWDHARLIANLAGRARESRETFVEHYRAKYTSPYMPPLWAVTELMTFGELSKWVEATKDARLRGAIARDIGLPTQESLVGTLQLLSYVRNICAHHGRLWNRKTVKRLPRMRIFEASIVLEVNAANQQFQPSNHIYNVLTVLALLMRHQAADTTFPQRVTALAETRNSEQLAAMGFPADWRERPAWQ